MAAVSCGTSHASALHHFGGYFETHYKKLVTHVESCASAVSCGTSHASALHHFGGYSKMHYKKLVTRVESHANAVSLLRSKE